MTVGALYADWMRLLTTQGLRGRPIAASTAAHYRKNWHRHIAPRCSKWQQAETATRRSGIPTAA